MDDNDKVRQGLGQVAQFLRQQERVNHLIKLWKESTGEHDYTPTAETLIDFCSPWKPSKDDPPLSEQDLLELIAPHFCFVKRHRGHGVDLATRSRQFIALKTEPKLIPSGYSKGLVRAEMDKDGLSITLVQPSGSWVRLGITIAAVALERGWWVVEIHNALENVSYPGTLADVPLKEFKIRLQELVEHSGGATLEVLDKNMWQRAAAQGQLLQEFVRMQQNLIKTSARFNIPRTGYAFEYLLEQFEREGCAYAEYMENGTLHWVFLSKFYDGDRHGHEQRFFHGRVGEAQIEVVQVSAGVIRNNPSRAFQISQNMNNALAQFDPVAFDQFWRLLTIGRSIFVTHQSDN